MTPKQHSAIAISGTLKSLDIARPHDPVAAFCTVVLPDGVLVRVLLVGEPALRAGEAYFTPGERVGLTGRLAQDDQGLFVVAGIMSRWDDGLKFS